MIIRKIAQSIVGLSFAALVTLAFVAPAPAREYDGIINGWTCEGPVGSCKQKDTGDKDVWCGCANARGVDHDQDVAKAHALEDCEKQLKKSQGGSWSCTDTSGLVCTHN